MGFYWFLYLFTYSKTQLADTSFQPIWIITCLVQLYEFEVTSYL